MKDFSRLFLVLCVSTSLLALFQFRSYLVEISSNFQHYLFFANLLGLILAYFADSGRKRILTWCLLVSLLAAQGLPLYRYYSPQPRSTRAAEVNFLYANLFFKNSNADLVLDEISKIKPDLVGLLETIPRTLEELSLGQIYPYSIERPTNDAFGLALYSNYKIVSVVDSLGDFSNKLIIAELEMRPDRRFRVVLLHCYPPLSQKNYLANFILLRRLSIHLRNSEYLPTILAGDFNATPHSTLFQNFITWNNLAGSTFGRGLFKTWSTKHLFLNLQIDHLLHSRDVELVDFKKLPEIGSDHFPLFASFALP